MPNVSEPPNVSDLTIKVLENIREELRALNTRVDRNTDELRTLNARVDSGFAGVDSGFARVDSSFARVDSRFEEMTTELAELRGEVRGTNRRLDSVLKIAGTHHTELEDRVSRIESHLGLTTG